MTEVYLLVKHHPNHQNKNDSFKWGELLLKKYNPSVSERLKMDIIHNHMNYFGDRKYSYKSIPKARWITIQNHWAELIFLSRNLRINRRNSITIPYALHRKKKINNPIIRSGRHEQSLYKQLEIGYCNTQVQDSILKEFRAKKCSGSYQLNPLIEDQNWSW